MSEPATREILVSLSEGLSPGSRAPLPADSVFQHPEVFRALIAGIAAVEAQEGKAMRRSVLPGKAGAMWTSEEDARLEQEFSANQPLEAIALAHERTVRAIVGRLQRLGLISADDVTGARRSGS